MKKKRPIRRVIVVLSALAAAFVVGDYLELFGSLIKDGAAVISYSFRIRDQARSRPVVGVSIRAYIHLNPQETVDLKSAFQREPDEEGIVRGAVLIGCGRRTTWLFEKYNSLKARKDDPIEFVFSHPSYRTETKAFTLKQLAKVQTVELVPKPGE